MLAWEEQSQALLHVFPLVLGPWGQAHLHAQQWDCDPLETAQARAGLCADHGGLCGHLRDSA